MKARRIFGVVAISTAFWTAQPVLGQAGSDTALGVKRSSGGIDVLGSALRSIGLSYVQRAGLGLSTRLRLAYNDDSLLVSFECEDTELTSAIQEDGRDLSAEDVVLVDLWLPGSDRHLTVQANALQTKTADWRSSSHESLGPPAGFDGIQVSSRVIGEGSFGDPGKPNQQNIEGWSVTIVIPYATLEVDPPRAGERWRANFSRIDYDSGDPAKWRWREESGEIEFH